MRTFVDTNVLVYARDTSEPDKHPAAQAWLEQLWTSQTGRTSTQVLNEYYVTVTRKLSPGLDRATARDDIRDLQAWRPSVIDHRTVAMAWDLEDRYSLSWWDSLVVASAIELGCDRLLTEDLQDGQQFDRLVVINPFRRAPS
jgi:predicted nucleic acid-binding protein